VDYLYSLYDALVSINVPNDKARAVVDAMERDMGTTLATKADLQSLSLATKADLENLRVATKSDLQSLRQEMTLLATKADVAELRADLRQEITLVRKDMEIMAANLSTTLTLRTGSMMAVVAGLLFAALRLT
jgi:hypothetical protein